VFSDIGTSCERLHIPHAFFFSSFKASASLAYAIPWAVSTRYFVNHVWLKINRRSRLRGGKLLLECLEWLTDNSNIMFFEKSSQRLRNSINIREDCILREIGGCGPFHTLGGTEVMLMAISSIASIHKLATIGLMGLPMAQPWICL